MSDSIKKDNLIVPVYINEKIVLDMLAIIEDGFSMVSQVSYAEHAESNSSQQIEAKASTNTSLLSKLLKIDVSGGVNHSRNNEEDERIAKEKVHTNVSLLSKFRGFLVNKKMLKEDFEVSSMKVGDFIEVEGELQKNPLINYLECLVDLYRMIDIFSDKPQPGNKPQKVKEKQQENTTLKQIKSFIEELKHTGTVDFVLSDKKGTVVLSAQEQYLENDNVSEIVGGRFKILGKVISICSNESQDIDLLRKTSLSIFPETMLAEMFSGFNDESLNKFNLPQLKTKIKGPAIMVIPIAIYA